MLNPSTLPAMPKNLLRWLLLCSLLMTCPGVKAQISSFGNSGFEAGDPTDWSIIVPSGTTATLAVSTGAAGKGPGAGSIIHSGTAMALALQTASPSWGNQVSEGATTLWETWTGTGGFDSHNHIYYGDISAWFMEYLAGIRPGSPGYHSGRVGLRSRHRVHHHLFRCRTAWK
jgi:hypothetical protein